MTYDREKYLFHEADAGTLLLSERLVPSPRTVALIIGFLVLWFAVWTPFAGFVGSIAGTVGMALYLGVLTVGSSLYKHEVRSRALLTGLTWPSARPYIIPWTSVDPSHIRLHHRSRFLDGQPENPVSWTYRFAPWNTIVVSVPGLARGFAHPRGRQRRRALINAYDIYPKNYPTELWHLGTRRPEQLLRAIEDALVAAGRADARGLTARELVSFAAERRRPSRRDRATSDAPPAPRSTDKR
jgi:hypothetical protein